MSQITDVTGLRAALATYAGSADDRRSIMRAARALGRTDILPREWGTAVRVREEPSHIEPLLVAKAAEYGVPLPKLRCVYMRGIAEYAANPVTGVSATLWARARVNSFLRLTAGDQTARRDDADLLALTAAAHGAWDERLHPRDKNGEWIDKIGSILRITGGYPGSEPDVAVPYASKRDGEIEVKITKSPSGAHDIGEIVTVKYEDIEVINAKARLGGPAPVETSLPERESEDASAAFTQGTMVLYDDVEWRVTEVFGDEVVIENETGSVDIVMASSLQHLGRKEEISTAPVAARRGGRFDAWGLRAGEIQAARDYGPDINELVGFAQQGDVEPFDRIYSFKRDNIESAVGQVDVRHGIDGRVVRIKGGFYQDGQIVGDWVREIHLDLPGGPEMFNESIELDESMQGQGIATEFYRNAENWGIANGVVAINLHANIDIGGYAWARAGYDWDTHGHGMWDPSEVTNIFEAVLDEARASQDQDTIAQASNVLERAMDALNDNEHEKLPTPFELAHVGWREGATDWAGKSGMLGSSWAGVKVLTPANQTHHDSALGSAISSEKLMTALSQTSFDDIRAGRLSYGMKVVRLNDTGESGEMGEVLRITTPDGRTFYVKREDVDEYVSNEIDASEFFRAAGVLGMYRARRSSVGEPVTIMEAAGVGVNFSYIESPRDRSFMHEPKYTTELAKKVAGGPDHLLRMFALDMAIANMDRHEGNVMIGHLPNGEIHVLPLDHSLAVTYTITAPKLDIADTAVRDDSSASTYAIFYAAALRARRASGTRAKMQQRATEKDAEKFRAIIRDLREASRTGKLSAEGFDAINTNLWYMEEHAEDILDKLYTGTAALA